MGAHLQAACPQGPREGRTGDGRGRCFCPACWPGQSSVAAVSPSARPGSGLHGLLRVFLSLLWSSLCAWC